MSTMSAEELSFEQAMEALEDIVSKMEQGDITLEQSLQSFEKGIALARRSQTLLEQAQQKVKILTQDGQVEKLDDFQVPD
ncbi:exodeoxyribonuclease VII small subunit [Glaciecola sp. XM2]|uniref:exodeoxyribonuclease VII small subunit n=1 Tax=Glaciecola sp. XM2 TaxID=1914931 RepID=UPI001BDE0528|nr:exodeoxyribonuclease VII small subunit [Glaciecola sp. XM2]